MITFQRDKDGKVVCYENGSFAGHIYTYGDCIIEETQKEQEQKEKEQKEKEKKKDG